MKNLVLSIYMVLGTAFVFQGCAPVEFVGMRPVHAGGNPNTPTDPTDPTDPDDPKNPCHCQKDCYEETFKQRDNPRVNKLDIIFVTDTSGSLDLERNAVADGISNFVGQLNSGMDFNIGVMLAHGSTSSHTGKLYKTSTSGEPLVLKSSELAISQIKTHLRRKLTTVVSDDSTDGGEMGLYSTSQALKAGNKEAIINAGMFRADAALAIVYISDENDICAVYPSGITPVPDSQNLEPGARVRDCEGISPEGVYAQLKTLKGSLPLAIGGVIYNNPATVPHIGVDENEVGYGYTNIIALANGVSVDMAANNIANDLASIGTNVNGNINYQTEFQLNSENIDPATIKVFVNGTQVAFTYDASTNKVKLNLSVVGIPNADIKVIYCLEEDSEVQEETY